MTSWITNPRTRITSRRLTAAQLRTATVLGGPREYGGICRVDLFNGETVWGDLGGQAADRFGLQLGAIVWPTYEDAVRAEAARTVDGPYHEADAAEIDRLLEERRTYLDEAVTVSYRIQTDEECGADEIWDALHDYADIHPAPAALAPFVDRHELGDFRGVEVSADDGEAALAWLAKAGEALGWAEGVTPVIVQQVQGETVEDYTADLAAALEWAGTADAGDYLVRYEDTGMTDRDDPGSRCGYGDDELDAIQRELSPRGLMLQADDVGLVAAKASQ